MKNKILDKKCETEKFQKAPIFKAQTSTSFESFQGILRYFQILKINGFKTFQNPAFNACSIVKSENGQIKVD